MIQILVPTDFSNAAQNALQYAVEFAKAVHGKVILYHVFAPPIVPVTEAPWTVLPGASEITDETMTRLKKELQEFTSSLEVPAECRTAEGGAVDKIIEFAEREHPEYIIMGMKHAGVLKEYIIGSVATSVIKKVQVPVLLIPESYKFKNIERVVFACDYEIEDTTILDSVKQFVESFTAQLSVLNVSAQPVVSEINNAATELKLGDYFKNINHSFHFTENDDVIEGLNKFIAQSKADIIATVSHKHNLIETIFRKDHNKRIAFHASVPVLTIPDNHKKVAAYFV
jgi:nucleotide-binding universal stress UspA family protein